MSIASQTQPFTSTGLLLSAFLLTGPSVSQAQSTPPAQQTSRVGVTVSGGLGLASVDFGRQFAIALSGPQGELILRLAQTWTFFAVFDDEESARDIALLYGLRRSGPKTWIRAAAGLGIVSGHHHAGEVCGLLCFQSSEPFDAVGLALQVDAVWAPISQLGIGVGAFGNLNSGESFGGVMLNLHLGRVR